MPEPTSRTDRAVHVLRGLLDDDGAPACLLDEDFNLVYWNPAFDQLARTHWSIAARALAGRNLLTSLPLPAPLLLALACLKGNPKTELLPRLELGPSGEVWDARILPYKEEGTLAGVLMLFQERTIELQRHHKELSQLQLLQALLATTEEAVVWVTPEGQARIESEAAARLFGGKPGGAPRPLSELLSGLTVLRFDGTPLSEGQNPFEAARAGRSLPATTFLLQQPPHPNRLCRIAVTPVLALQGQPTASLVMILDLSAAIEPEEPGQPEPARLASELAVANPFLESLLEAIPAVLYFVDPELRLQLANPYLLRRLGVEAQQVVGKPIQEVLALPVDYMNELREAMGAATYVHRPYVAYTDPVSGRLTYWDNYLTPVRDRAGAVRGLVVMSNDVTWRVELTQALADKVHQLAAIVGHIADGVLVATPEGELLLVNEAAQRMLNLPPDATLASLEKLDIRGLDNVPIPVEHMPIMRVLQGDRVGEFVLRVADEHGREAVLATSGSAIRDERRRVLMGVLIFHDITEEYRLRGELTAKVRELEGAVCSLRELDKLKTDFLNTISHELRTPLTNIMGYVELIEDEVVGPLLPAQREATCHVMDSARHLLTLINDLLDFTQLEAGKIAFSFVPVPLPTMVNQLLPAMETKSGRHLETETIVEPGLPRARADYNRLMQVLENLLDNAYKFTPEGGRVTVSMRREGEHAVRVEIADTGIGIPKEALPRLFSKFYQVESGLRRERGGTGLGLAICKMLIEGQSGHIGIASKQGEGTRVWFTLPVWSDGEPPADDMVG